MKKMIALGFEGSTNKIGVGVVTLDGSILSNPRHTHLCYPARAGIPSPRNCPTPWKPIVAVNHCVAHIEMGRVVTGADDPVVLYVNCPYVVKGMDVPFSGILMCFRCLWRLMAHTDKKDVLIVGCSERLQEMVSIMCSERGGGLFVTDDMYCVDNGAMIVYTGLLAYANGMSTPLEESTFTQRFRTDEVLAIWRERKRILQMVSWKKVSNYLHVSRYEALQQMIKLSSCGQIHGQFNILRRIYWAKDQMTQGHANMGWLLEGNKEGLICRVAKIDEDLLVKEIHCQLHTCSMLYPGLGSSTELEPLQTGPTVAKDQVLDMKHVDLVGLVGLACLFKGMASLRSNHGLESIVGPMGPITEGEVMAERAVISVIQYLGPFLAGEVELLKGVHKEIISIKAELERIHSFLEDAEARVETGDKGVKIWVKQVRQVACRIQDVIDEHILLVLPKQPGLFSSLRKVTRTITKLKPRHEMASQVQDIKTTIREIKEGADRYGFSTSTLSEHSSTSTSGITNDNIWRDPRLASLFIGDDEVVGIESPKYELISRLVDQNQSQRAVISVVGMGGIGKTTLAKKVYDSQEVVAHFNCKAWITLSGIDVLHDEGIESLIVKLRGYLSEKRLLHFAQKTSVDHVHELQALSQEKAWKLFCTKAFQLDFGSHCPPELEEVSQAIVRKCQGLPLAIAAIGGLLSTKNKSISEWQKFYGSMNSELERNPELKSISKFLLFSYNDLPHPLKSCFLYFGIMPEDYSIKAGRLIRLWIAEGFVEEQTGKHWKNVREFKFQCHNSLAIYAYGYCNMDKVMKSISKSPVRSVFLFQRGELPKKPLLGTIAANFKLLKVLDLEDAPLDQLDEEVGNLFLLRYLSIRSTHMKIIPKSIGKLQNLQTLDLKYSPVSELPFDISRLCKLRHLLAYSRNHESEYLVDLIVGVKIQEGIGGLEELKSLWYVETNHGLIKELEKLRQLRKLGIMKLEREHGRALCAAIEKMKCLKRLSAKASSADEILDLQHISSSSPPQYLQRLELVGRLEKLPDWIPKLQNLVVLSLVGSGLTKNDPLKALQVLPSLVGLLLWDAYDGEQLYFEVGRFQKLKELCLLGFKGMNSVIIEEGALPLREDLTIEPSPQLKEVPSGIHHLRNLKTLGFVGMPEEFIDRMEPKPNQGKDYWIVEHIPHVELWSRIGKRSRATHMGSLQQYFNQKVENARVKEDKNVSPSRMPIQLTVRFAPN
ncbi:unnamed protein product [Camellia sinensis]